MILLGERNSKINIIREAFPGLVVIPRGDIIKIKGDKKRAQLLKKYLEIMLRLIQEDNDLTEHTVKDILAGKNPFDYKITESSSNNTIVFGNDGRPIKAKTRNQKLLVEASEKNDIVFAIGPAGTGKTYTAVALAIRSLRNQLVKKIILTRPAVEAGENLGFLPGDLKEKVDPYLRPLYDALDDMLPIEKLNYMMENRIIEIAPLAFMRGRTLDNAFIILDEAQNATIGQLKMFLTRIGPSAKSIITGDLSQIDLPHYQKSGLKRTVELLKNINGISQIELSYEDVIRHRLVKQILSAFDYEELRIKKLTKKSKSEEE